MIITIDTDTLGSTGLTPNEYVYLMCLGSGHETPSALGLSYSRLIGMNYIIRNSEGIPSITDYGALTLGMIAGTTIRNSQVVSDPLMDIPSWIDEYRNLFPAKIRSGGYPVRGSKKGCLRKMEKFVRENPQYTKDTILASTAEYVNSRNKVGYQHMKIADYFIEKDGVSMLAAECEWYLSNEVTSDESAWGRDV